MRFLRIIPVALLCAGASAQIYEPPPLNPDVLIEHRTLPNGSEQVLPDRSDSRVRDNTKPVPREQTRVAVLGYHNFSEKKPVTEMLMRTSKFREQMETIRRTGLRVISMSEFLEWRLGNQCLPARCVLITLDDGWRSVYTDAYPILKEYGYPFTLFLYTKYLSGQGDSMTPEMVREMQTNGATIGSHSTSHYYPSRWKKEEADGGPRFDVFMETEMKGSCDKLSQLFGPINTYCYPGGYVTPTISSRLSDYGYVAAFTVIPGKVTVHEDVLHIHRYMVFGTTDTAFRRAINFDVPQNMPGLHGVTTDLPPPSFPVHPSPHSQVTEHVDTISAQMSGLGDVDWPSVQMRVSGFGRVPAKVEGATGTISWAPPIRIYQPSVTVCITWKSTDGTRRQAQWSFAVTTQLLLPET